MSPKSLTMPVNCREEQEKLNVWVAYLNLENMYGTHEALTEVFERAVKYNDPLKIHPAAHHHLHPLRKNWGQFPAGLI